LYRLGTPEDFANFYLSSVLPASRAPIHSHLDVNCNFQLRFARWCCSKGEFVSVLVKREPAGPLAGFPCGVTSCVGECTAVDPGSGQAIPLVLVSAPERVPQTHAGIAQAQKRDWRIVYTSVSSEGVARRRAGRAWASAMNVKRHGAGRIVRSSMRSMALPRIARTGDRALSRPGPLCRVQPSFLPRNIALASRLRTGNRRFSTVKGGATRISKIGYKACSAMVFYGFYPYGKTENACPCDEEAQVFHGAFFQHDIV
jgi:hypothetical protein